MLCLHVIEEREGHEIGDLRRRKRAGEKLTLTSDGGARAVRVLLRSARDAGRVTNGKVARELAEGLLVEWSDPSKPLTLTLND